MVPSSIAGHLTHEPGGQPRWLPRRMSHGSYLNTDPNRRDEGGKTPIHCAIRSRIVRDPADFVLVEFGAELNLRNSDGRTALDEALMQTGKSAETYFPIRPIAPKRLNRTQLLKYPFTLKMPGPWDFDHKRPALAQSRAR